MTVLQIYILIVIHQLVFGLTERHVCGGQSGLQVIEDLYVNNPRSNKKEELDQVFDTSYRKSSWIEKHATRLIRKYLQSNRILHHHQHLLLSATVPDCANYMINEVEALELNTGDVLQQQYTVLLEMISVLATMENEESINGDDVFSHSLRGIRVEAEQLLCELYVGIDISNGAVPSRTIPSPVALCLNRSLTERYQRDYILLNRIKDISKHFQNQYMLLLVRPPHV